MGGFLFSTKNENIENALTVFQKKGLALKDEIKTENYSLFVYDKLGHKTENIVRYATGDFIIAVGTFIYKNAMGTDALTKFFHDFSPDDEALRKIGDEILGHYCVILNKNERIHFFNDSAGLYHVFLSETEGILISNSYLAILSVLNEKTVSKQEIYEFIFRGAFYGGKTLCQEVSMIDCNKVLVFDGKTLNKNIRNTCIGSATKNNDNLKINLDIMLQNLRAYFQVIKKHFDGSITSDLTAGYDTRLINCLLKDQSIRHCSAVAGDEDDIDVQIAQEIAMNEHVNLTIYDRENEIRACDNTRKLLLDAYYVCDGIATEVIPSGPAIVGYCKERSKLSKLTIGGGGGENIRAYGKWSQSKPITILDFLRKHYSNIDTTYCNDFDIAEFYTNLGEKIKANLQIKRDCLYPHEIQMLYQTFRMRYWGGRGLSAYNQISYYLAPFADPRIALAALAIPTRFKKNAALQRKMIRKLDSRLASYPSDSGYSFSRIGSLKYCVVMTRKTVRSYRERVRSYVGKHTPSEIKDVYRRLRSKATPGKKVPYYLQEDFLQTIFGGGYEVSKYIDIGKCKNSLILSRCYSLELLLRTSQLS